VGSVGSVERYEVRPTAPRPKAVAVAAAVAIVEGDGS
jgi:hypothetical protein